MKHFTGIMNTYPHICFHKTLSICSLCFPGLIGSYGPSRPPRPLPFIRKNVSLVYGQVQSGKTSMIFNLIQLSTLCSYHTK